MKTSIIKGIGYYVPENIVKNKDLEKIMDTSDEWIQERTGIRERRWVLEDSDESTSSMGTEAAKKAIKNAQISPDEIDFIIFATLSPDYFFPGSGVLIQRNLGLKEVGALDIRNQCSGFIYALSIADQYIRAQTYHNILVITSEVQSTSMDLSNTGRDTAVIFADGAAAAVLSGNSNREGILSTHLHTQGKYAKELWVESPSSAMSPKLDESIIKSGKHFLKMNGKEVFKHAVKRFPEVIIEALNYNNLNINDINLLIPHQANIRISQMVQRKLGLKDNQIFSNIHKYGNTTSASIPIALCEAINNKQLNKGDILILAAFGSGFSWASAILRW